MKHCICPPTTSCDFTLPVWSEFRVAPSRVRKIIENKTAWCIWCVKQTLWSPQSGASLQCCSPDSHPAYFPNRLFFISSAAGGLQAHRQQGHIIRLNCFCFLLSSCSHPYLFGPNYSSALKYEVADCTDHNKSLSWSWGFFAIVFAIELYNITVKIAVCFPTVFLHFILWRRLPV